MNWRRVHHVGSRMWLDFGTNPVHWPLVCLNSQTVHVDGEEDLLEVRHETFIKVLDNMKATRIGSVFDMW